MTAYRTARNVYQRLLNREYWRHRQAQKGLYGAFVKSGSLVFDIGANRGDVSETFLDLGAETVVAIEPNPRLAGEILRRFGRAVRVENVAVGAKPGRADLIVGKDSGHSTLSKEWTRRAPSNDRWLGTMVSTEVTTLDALIDKYGRPNFIKIDVEAYEAEVLSGLTVPVDGLCFEYQAAYLEVAERCLELLGDRYRYALTTGEEPTLVTGWLEQGDVLEKLGTLDHGAYGDVFARPVAPTG